MTEEKRDFRKELVGHVEYGMPHATYKIILAMLDEIDWQRAETIAWERTAWDLSKTIDYLEPKVKELEKEIDDLLAYKRLYQQISLAIDEVKQKCQV